MTTLDTPSANVTANVVPRAGTERAVRWLLPGILAVGTLLRAPLYFSRPSLLLDEARLALNIASRSWLELARPLDYDQTAALLFLWASKLATLIGGVNEYSLRAVAFAASILTLPLMYAVGRRLCNREMALVATAIAAVSPILLQYVRQVKPYTLETLVGLGLLWLALDLVDQPRERRRAWRLAVAAAVAVWASTTAIFVLAGLLAVLWTAAARVRPARQQLAVIGLAAAISFLPAYWVVYQPGAANAYLQQFWQGSMLTLWEPGFPARAWQGTRELIWQTFSGGSTEPPLEPFYDVQVNVCAVALLLLGLAGVKRMVMTSGSLRAGLVYAPLAVAFAASLVGRYPIAARVMMFAVPALVFAVASGVLHLAHGAPRRYQPVVLAVAGGCLLALALPLALNLATEPQEYEDVRTAVRAFRSRQSIGEPVYVFATALPAWTFYTTDWTNPDRERLARMARLGSSGGSAFENAPPRGRAITADEGQEMHYPLGPGSEAIGLYHGAQWRSATGPVQMSPDTNWVARETVRILEIARTTQTVWVLATRTLGVDYYLFNSIGWCEDDGYRARGVLLVRLKPGVSGPCRVPAPLRPVDAPPIDDHH